MNQSIELAEMQIRRYERSRQANISISEYHAELALEDALEVEHWRGVLARLGGVATEGEI